MIKLAESPTACVGRVPQKTFNPSNPRQAEVLIENMSSYFDGDLKGKRIAVWGLQFQPDIEDICQSPAIALIDWLLLEGATVAVHQRQTMEMEMQMENIRAIYDDALQYHADKYDAVRRSDALVLMTDSGEYAGTDPGNLRWHIKGAVVFDGCNCLNREWFAYSTFDYYCIGQEPLLWRARCRMLNPQQNECKADSGR